MKCEKCGKEIENLLVDMFNYDGTDSDYLYPVVECEENAAYIDTTQNWTGYELSEEEKLDTIACPHCGKFPFEDKEIQVYNIVRVVCFRRNTE